MSIATAFAPHLPLLRRYSRALTGSQKSGDAFVRAALEALLAGVEEVAASDSPKVALFRLFHAVWRGAADQYSADQTAALFDYLPQRGREALLLTAVEGFSTAEAARILGIDASAVAEQVALARRAIATDLASRVLIIEDEAIIALDLQNIVEKMGHSVIGIATTHREATSLAASERPDLILADIRLADGSSGIDAVREILETIAAPVIFITAFPERLLTGDRPEPTYLINKPFLPDTVRATIAQALLMLRANGAAGARNYS